MPVDRGNIREVVRNAWRNAQDRSTRQPSSRGTKKSQVNKERSKQWIEALAGQFNERYGDRRHKLFWSGNDENRQQFRIKEFLFDLAVCSVSMTKSLQAKPQDLAFIAQCH